MMETKKWYTSKILWSGVIVTLIGALQFVEQWLETATYSVSDFVILATGILTVVFRVWFTDTPIKHK
jgi:SNF family Na+-dependent transporter